MWVLPEPADIHADGEKLYVLKAPLSVRMEAEHIELPREKGGPGDCPEADEATRDHNEALFRSLILPELTKLVNGDPHYADLRRVHLSRVAAQWYRELGASRPTTYGELVDGGDIDAWTTRTGWKPKDTFDRYVHSYTEGDYRYSREETKGTASGRTPTCTGVSTSPPRRCARCPRAPSPPATRACRRTSGPR
ncbi:hypothetical protein ACFQ60_41095 [Streptomyces zhihengii]